MTPEDFATIMAAVDFTLPKPEWFPLALRALFATGCRPAEIVGARFRPGREPEEGGPRISRRKEHAGLRAGDVLPNWRIHVRGKHTTPKGRTHDLKQRIVLCADREVHAALRCLADRAQHPADNLFLPRSRDGVTALGARVLALRKHLPAHLRAFTPRMLRHGHAIAALRAGVDLKSVSLQLGHESLETTSIYLRFATMDEGRYLSAFASAAPALAERSCPSCGFGWREDSTTGSLDLGSRMGRALRRR